MLAHYNANLGARHLDVGPGTGWYLKRATYPTTSPEVTLMDLNPATMKLTTSRLAGRGIVPTSHTGSVLAPIDSGLGQFDSVAANFVMHCVPGTWAEKGAAFTHIAAALDDDGVFFGSTILGTGVPHDLLGKALCALYNGPMKVFHNRHDDRTGLEKALEAAFETVDLTVAVFAARGPRRP